MQALESRPYNNRRPKQRRRHIYIYTYIVRMYVYIVLVQLTLNLSNCKPGLRLARSPGPPQPATPSQNRAMQAQIFKLRAGELSVTSKKWDVLKALEAGCIGALLPAGACQHGKAPALRLCDDEYSCVATRLHLSFLGPVVVKPNSTKTPGIPLVQAPLAATREISREQ